MRNKFSYAMQSSASGMQVYESKPPISMKNIEKWSEKGIFRSQLCQKLRLNKKQNKANKQIKIK